MSEIWLKVPFNDKLMPELREMAKQRGLEVDRWCSEVLMDRISSDRLTRIKSSGGEPMLPGNKR